MWSTGAGSMWIADNASLTHWVDGIAISIDALTTPCESIGVDVGAWGDAGGVIWACTACGGITKRDGAAMAMDSGAATDLTAVWGTSGADVWVVGDAATILRHRL